jgi:hypothetical protein
VSRAGADRIQVSQEESRNVNTTPGSTPELGVRFGRENSRTAFLAATALRDNRPRRALRDPTETQEVSRSNPATDNHGRVNPVQLDLARADR